MATMVVWALFYPAWISFVPSQTETQHGKCGLSCRELKRIVDMSVLHMYIIKE